MLITFISLSHYVAEFEITNSALIGSENQTDGMNELNSNFSMTYYILTVLPGKFLY
jgi:myo-inositol-hexaphosphate 3-phosphohydrolase